MTKITFIIGNGFDINLKMKTSYRDFYKYAIEKYNQNNDKNSIYDNIKDDFENWCDFEISLGKYTKTRLNKTLKSSLNEESNLILQDYNSVMSDLLDYLSIEEEKYFKKKLDVNFTKDCFYEELNAGQYSTIDNLLFNQRCEVNLITLNYTSVLETMRFRWNRQLSNFNITNIHHIHGTLSDNLTVGVSNESQLSPILNDSVKKYLIKPASIELANDSRMKIMDNILNSSSIIIIFGTSLGYSDMHLWEKIGEYLLENQGAYLILHKRDLNYTKKADAILSIGNPFKDKVINSFLSKTSISSEYWSSISSRIFVIHNTKKLFSINETNNI